MQNLTLKLLEHKLFPIEAQRFIASLEKNDLCMLLAQIEFTRWSDEHLQSIDDINFLLTTAADITAKDKDIIPGFERDFCGNKVVTALFEGSESEFWLSHILGTDYRPVYICSKQHHVYAHRNHASIIEFDNHRVYFRFGTKSTLLNYLILNRPISEDFYVDDLFTDH